MRIADISCSREHGLLRYEKDGHFYVEDLGSKFGTLLLVQDIIKIDCRSPIPQEKVVV